MVVNTVSCNVRRRRLGTSTFDVSYVTTDAAEVEEIAKIVSNENDFKLSLSQELKKQPGMQTVVVETIKSEITKASWTAGSWGDCSKDCKGTQTRTITCTADGQKVEDSFCSGNKPDSSQSCGDKCDVGTKTATTESVTGGEKGMDDGVSHFCTLAALLVYFLSL